MAKQDKRNMVWDYIKESAKIFFLAGAIVGVGRLGDYAHDRIVQEQRRKDVASLTPQRAEIRDLNGDGVDDLLLTSTEGDSWMLGEKQPDGSESFYNFDTFYDRQTTRELEKRMSEDLSGTRAWIRKERAGIN